MRLLLNADDTDAKWRAALGVIRDENVCNLLPSFNLLYKYTVMKAQSNGTTMFQHASGVRGRCVLHGSMYAIEIHQLITRQSAL